MPANLDTKKDGEAAVFVVGEPAWHREGVVFDEPPSLAEAIQASGLDYEVKLVPAYARVPSLLGEGFPPHYWRAMRFRATVRGDRTGEAAVLGIVGDRYEVVPNAAAWEFFRIPVERGDVILESAGALDGGRTAWIMARLPEAVKVGGDITEPYVLLSNSFDGSHAVVAGYTAVRVVCQNTHDLAMRAGIRAKVSIRHTESAPARLKEASRVLMLAREFFEAYQEAGEAMLRQQVSDEQREAVWRELYPDPAPRVNAEGKRVVSPQAGNKRRRLEEAHEAAPGQEHIRGTAWGIFNAVTYYADHVFKPRGENTRMKGTVLRGFTHKLKRRAFKACVDLV